MVGFVIYALGNKEEKRPKVTVTVLEEARTR